MVVKMFITHSQMCKLCRHAGPMFDQPHDETSIYDVVQCFDELLAVEVYRTQPRPLFCDYLLWVVDEYAAVEFKLRWL